MKNLKKMIKEIDIKTIEKVINILSGLKVFKKYNCETCKHEISSICLDCDIKNKSKSWEPKEPEKSIEEQIFELIDESLEDIHIDIVNFEDFKDWFSTEGISNFSFYFKQCLFLAVMKGVHELIEDDNDKIKDWFICRYYNDYFIDRYKTNINFPDYFYFSLKENAEKAKNILSNFFGKNILDWWYK